MDGRVLLFNVHRTLFDTVDLQLESPGLLALAAFLETRGYDALVFQGEPTEAKTFFERQAREGSILAAGFYCDFENQIEVCALSAAIANGHGVPVLLGGPQVAGFDADYLTRSRCMAAVVGEGELTLCRLLDAIRDGSRDWRKIDGIVHVDEAGSVVRNPVGPVVQDLDELPYPAFHRWVNKPRRRQAHVMSGRGCPFQCAFCYEGSLSRPVRLRSVERAMGEVEAILASEPDMRYLAFSDDTFTISPERVREFCTKLAELRKKRDFIWYCEGHVKLLDRWPHLLGEMSRAGMRRLQIGIESGDQRVLDVYGKKTTVEEIERVVKAGADAGVHQMVGFFITGGPFESPETLARNKAFYERLIDLAPGVIEIGPSPLMPYPETAIGRCPEKFGLRVVDPNGTTTFSDYPVTETEEMDREAIAKSQRELVEHGIRAMRRAFREGKVPHERVLDAFRDLAYGAASLWHTAVYSVMPFVAGYYTLLARGAVSRSTDVPEAELDGWRPQRIMEMWHDVDFSAGFPQIGRDVLSPLEFELLLYCTGKLRLRQVLDRVYEKFSQNFDSRSEYEESARRILKSFEGKYWLAYAPL
ncbi:MAG: B12-binding domain-containing radical SAM protein [Acidobacteriota bacterium]